LQHIGPLADSFEAGVPTARVVRIAHAKHAVFEPNGTEVVNEINLFIDGLKN
jgi:non-heme chloroperoxidase